MKGFGISKASRRIKSEILRFEETVNLAFAVLGMSASVSAMMVIIEILMMIMTIAAS